MTIKGFLSSLTVALSMIFAGSAQADNTQGISDTTIKIGNLGPFTGQAAAFNPLNFGPEAYLRYVNEKGGIHGRKFETVFADDSCNEAKGIAAAKKLIYEDKVFMIMGNPCSGVAMAIKPTLEKEGVPWMGASANPKLTRPTVPGMFHVTYTGIESGSNMARFALSIPGNKKVAIVAHSNDWAHGYCNPATDYIKANGGEVVVNAAMENGSTDATAQVLLVKSSGAQAVLGCLYQPELVVLIRDMKKYGVNAPVIGALGADFDQVIQQVRDISAVKQRFFQPYQFNEKIGEGSLKEFHDIFVKYLTKDELPKVGPPTNFYYFGVPVAIATVEAFRRAGPNPTREKWIAAMETLDKFDTRVLADVVTITRDSHVGVSAMNAIGIDDKGEPTLYKAFGIPLTK